MFGWPRAMLNFIVLTLLAEEIGAHPPVQHLPAHEAQEIANLAWTALAGRRLQETPAQGEASEAMQKEIDRIVMQRYSADIEEARTAVMNEVLAQCPQTCEEFTTPLTTTTLDPNRPEKVVYPDPHNLCPLMQRGKQSLPALVLASNVLLQRKPIWFVHLANQGDYLLDLMKAQGEVPLVGRSGIDDMWNWRTEVGAAIFDAQQVSVTTFPFCNEKYRLLRQNGATMTSVSRWLDEGRDICHEEFLYVTTMREPVARMVDYMGSEKLHPEDVMKLIAQAPEASGASRTWGAALSWQMQQQVASCWAPESRYQHFDNFVIRSLLGSEVYFLPEGEITFEHMQRARLLLKSFDIVIADENLIEEYEDIISDLHWDEKIKPHKKGVQSSSAQESSALTDWHIRMLQSQNAPDIMLYNLIKSGNL